ncbi:DUF1214 domain-containing protein [Flammeovirga pacifica]|uniref:DUF1254 domain-containing protein n=1 Tax=Flammeovirga pacifica TaxID=915059 RepID=A0A1S1Z2G1_FLAPC|nr:DUF1214 domain-containing protein [Flammeovirga pacifica]OHX67458.1 hypothetical protein NH26_14445 [Flammeovirga pacifica]
MKNIKVIYTVFLSLFVSSVFANDINKKTVEIDKNGYAILTDSQIKNIVERSYQYVAMYNVNNKYTASPKSNFTTGGWNKAFTNTELYDHHVNLVARPNNDALYQVAMLDLQDDAIVIEFPSFNSKYISLMVSGYDHYVDMPLSTVSGDFDKPTKILFHSERTKGYNGEPIEGIDHVYEASGDFIIAALRIMPHANETERYNQIVEEIESIKGMSLSEYKGGAPTSTPEMDFPATGETDEDVFENNLLEVMQFVFNHTSFDENNEMDQEVLAAYKPLGIAPGKTYNPNTDVKIDGEKFRDIADKVKAENLAKMLDPELVKKIGAKIFQPKGKTDLDAILAVSIIGPIGIPMDQAMYFPVNASDGSVMNAQNDYVIKMTKEDLPPANAFWSLTLYDQDRGFFIPNDNKKYSVGENAGFKLNEDGGIDIYVSVEKPDGVPEENWLPINLQDQNLDILCRLYAPNLEKIKTWTVPKAEKINRK